MFLKLIFNQKEKRDFIWPKTFYFLFEILSIFRSEKRGITLKIAVPELFIFLKSTCLLLRHLCKIYLESERKVLFYLVQNFRFFVSKTFEFLFRK